MADELKPCPFCGHEPKLLKDDYGAHLPDEYPEGGRTWIVCANRHCTSGHKFNTEGSAITAWNTRAQGPSTSGADEREEIARIIDPLVFELSDALDNAEGEPEALRNEATALRDQRLSTALAKADAILARQGPGPGEAVAWRWRHVPYVGWSYASTKPLRPDLEIEPLYAATPTREA